jgi:hypothetical protein
MVVLDSVSGNKRNEYDGHLAGSSVPSTKQAKPNHIEREEKRDIGIEDADRNAIFVDQLGQLVNKEKGFSASTGCSNRYLFEAFVRQT